MGGDGLELENVRVVFGYPALGVSPRQRSGEVV